MAATVGSVELGFVEETDSWRLKSKFFPSKVGGKPAWLSLVDLPNPSDLKCSECGDPCSFLLQVYAPRDERPETFHRTLYVFVCTNSLCPDKQRTGHVFRCQLPRSNSFYSFDPAPEDANAQCQEDCFNTQGDQLCVVCGCAGPKRCSKCRLVSYCSKTHQLVHWKVQGHKEECGLATDTTQIDVFTTTCLLREFELVTEPESETVVETERSEDERIQEYEEFLRSPNAQTIMHFADVIDLEAMASNSDDKVFRLFKKRIEKEPSQVLRYQPGGVPLWVSSQQIPTPEDISPCSACGTPCVFEFQVMPQILNHLGLDRLESSSLDFGTLAVYTCPNSCSQGATYQREFLWSQHIT